MSAAHVYLSCSSHSHSHSLARSQGKHDNDWFKKAAKEMDMELDPSVMTDEPEDAAQVRVNLNKWESELRELLAQPILQQHTSKGFVSAGRPADADLQTQGRLSREEKIKARAKAAAK